LDYCRLHDVTIQAWSPFQKPNWGGPFLGSEDYAELNQTLREIGEKYDATPTMMAAAWILRHPAHMQLIAGTTHMDHMSEILKAADIDMTREEWYRIYLSAGHILP
jgi:predicted oxidoreductase